MAEQIRINELARELEIKAKVLIEYLPVIGVEEKKTHSSSIDVEHAELVRKHFQQLAEQESAAEAAKSAAAKAKTARPAGPTITVPPRVPAAAPVAQPAQAAATAPPVPAVIPKPAPPPAAAPPGVVRPAI